MIAAPLETQETVIIKYLKKHGRSTLSRLNEDLEMSCRTILVNLIVKKRVVYFSEIRIQDCGYELTHIYIPSLKDDTLCGKIYQLIKNGTTRRDDIVKAMSYKYKTSTVNGRLSELKNSGLIEATTTYTKNKEFIIL